MKPLYLFTWTTFLYLAFIMVSANQELRQSMINFDESCQIDIANQKESCDSRVERVYFQMCENIVFNDPRIRYQDIGKNKDIAK